MTGVCQSCSRVHQPMFLSKLLFRGWSLHLTDSQHLNLPRKLPTEPHTCGRHNTGGAGNFMTPKAAKVLPVDWAETHWLTVIGLFQWGNRNLTGVILLNCYCCYHLISLSFHHFYFISESLTCFEFRLPQCLFYWIQMFVLHQGTWTWSTDLHTSIFLLHLHCVSISYTKWIFVWHLSQFGRRLVSFYCTVSFLISHYSYEHIWKHSRIQSLQPQMEAVCLICRL